MSAAGTIKGAPKTKGQIPLSNNSNVPRTTSESQNLAPGSDAGASTLSVSRQKQSKRDENLRRKLEADLTKKRHPTSRARLTRKAPPGTVLSLKPGQALQIKPMTTVAEAAQLMAAKREDCVLVTDDDERIAGIFTAKDLAFRVVGADIKARDITIEEIMTKNPLCAKTDTSATDALDLMVRKGFRHLPVMDENHDISGVLDITKCFHEAMEKLERAYNSSRKLYDALEGVQAELGSSQPKQIFSYVEAIRAKMSGPTLESVLTGLPPITVSVRTSVKDAAALMKENHTTAVLVQDHGTIAGIFTSKDVVLRVIAAGHDPNTCSVVRVMTPHPDFAPMDLSIQAALRKMHDGHYLNLPVTSPSGEIVGMVDVLKLTYATLDQINSMSAADSEGPAWGKFWMSFGNETESVMSGDGGGSHLPTSDIHSMISPESMRQGLLDRGDNVMPNESASRHGGDSPPHSIIVGVQSLPEDTPFSFKFKAPSGRVHRLKVAASAGVAELVSQVGEKLGSEMSGVGGLPVAEDGKLGESGFALSYLDNEGDTVSITTDRDLLEAITLASQTHRDKVDLFVHYPERPPLPSTADIQHTAYKPPTPPESTSRERRMYGYDVDQTNDTQPDSEEKILPQRQIIPGIPDELLLPGAIVSLAAAIVVVFVLSRPARR